MEDQRGIKRERSPSSEGNHSPSDAKNPLSAPSGSPPPSGSPSEISSRRPCSPVFEQGSSSRKAPVIDLPLSSDEENFITDTSRDAKFARKLFDDLNRDILRPPSGGKVIILDDSDEEKEAPDEKTVDNELVATSVAINPCQLPSSLLMMPLRGKKIIAMIKGLIRRPMAAMAMEVVMVHLRPPRRRPRC
jgi:hypothetical protein